MGYLTFGIIGIVLLWGHFETWFLRVIRTEFRSPRVPAAFDGFRIALIGNLHLRRLGGWTRRIQRLVKELQPDILLIAGNVKPSHAADNAKTHLLLSEFLQPLSAPGGVLCVRGYRDRKGFWDELPAQPRFQLLSNSHHRVTRGTECLVFLGIQTAHASHLDRGINQIRETLAPLGENEGLRILVGQSADLLRVAQGQPIPLILAVDNLHYQIRLPGIGVPRRDTKVPLAWERGWLREGPESLFLSSGLGIRWFPFRFFLRPEIVCVTLRRGP